MYLASENKDKKKEISIYFPNWEIICPRDIGIIFNPLENGESFLENAIIKATLLWNQVKEPVIADDSGICVTVLDNKPGIHSARYKGKTQAEKNANLIASLNKTIIEKKLSSSPENRTCFYVCSLVYYYGENRYISIQETMKGQLIQDIHEQRGSGGFGYDPIVFLPKLGKTVAELTNEEKNAISHRGKALKALQRFLN